MIIQSEPGDFLTKAVGFVAAVKVGDIDAAKAKLAGAGANFERIVPVAERFSDLDSAIDARAGDWEKREADPGFTGFHRLEYALFIKGDVSDTGPTADKLPADVTDLNHRITGLAIPPGMMVGGSDRRGSGLEDSRRGRSLFGH